MWCYMMLFVLVLVVIFGLSLMFISLNPISLGVIVWAVALMSALIMGLLVYSWFGYMIFLVYVGGLLVMFGYFAAISPNIKGGFWSGVVWYLLWSEVVGLVVMWVCVGGGMANIKPVYLLNKVQVGFLVSPVLYIFFSFLLFFVFVVVVKVSLKFEGPLRPFSVKYA